MEAVVAAAEAEPEKYASLVEKMDKSGKVSGPYKRLMVMQQGEAIRKEAPPIPSRGPYRVIVIDPPWPSEPDAAAVPEARAYFPYPTMTIQQICDVPVASIAHDDCVVWLWVTNFHMRYAFQALDAWGFKEKTILTWVKDKMGQGQRLRGKTEHCILATRGKPLLDLTNQTTAFDGRVRHHSQKPLEFYTMVETLCPASRYAEFFARGPGRACWDGHGDQAAESAA
jgi:N6-adenosine-specific RNA methylase IME4